MGTPPVDIPLPPDGGGKKSKKRPPTGAFMLNDPPIKGFINAFCDFFDKYIKIKRIELTETEIKWREELFSLLQNERFIIAVDNALDQPPSENGSNNEFEKKVKIILNLELTAATEKIRSLLGMSGFGTNADDLQKFFERERDNILTVVDSCREALDKYPLLKFILTTGKEIYQVILK